MKTKIMYCILSFNCLELCTVHVQCHAVTVQRTNTSTSDDVLRKIHKKNSSTIILNAHVRQIAVNRGGWFNVQGGGSFIVSIGHLKPLVQRLFSICQGYLKLVHFCWRETAAN